VRTLVCIGLILLSSCLAFGQSAEKPVFEIADVHVSPPATIASMGGGVPRNGRYEFHNATMLDLIRIAYGVTPETVFGGPAWLATDQFEVLGKIPPNTTVETARLMLQSLLAERFDLKVHNDSRPIPVFVLSLGKGKYKLKATEGASTGCQGVPGQPPAPGVIPLQQVTCHNLTSAQIAENLKQMANAYLDKPILDETKLEGSWDFDIKWTGRGQLAAAGADGISIFDAVDKQLGLKLDQQQRPMPVIVVDNVKRTPKANPPGVAAAFPVEKPEFEVSEIKPSPPGTQGIGIRYSPGGQIDAMGTLRDLIAVSNQILPNLASDYVVGPKFMETSHFTIKAKVPSTGAGAASRDNGREQAPPINVALQMLQSMLEERFKLKMHREDRPATVYALTAPKGEPKLKKPEASDRTGCRPDPGAIPSTITTPMNAMTCTNMTMDDLIKELPQRAGGYVDHPIVNASGIQGAWNFTLMWTPRGALDNRPANAEPGAAGGASDPGGISLFEAIDKQLGLKLEKGTHPLSVIVVDHAEEKPVD
jgi:uncharacterized protein (TIGR03435 family)